jgi:hypothetical protein
VRIAPLKKQARARFLSDHSNRSQHSQIGTSQDSRSNNDCCDPGWPSQAQGASGLFSCWRIVQSCNSKPSKSSRVLAISFYWRLARSIHEGTVVLNV